MNKEQFLQILRQSEYPEPVEVQQVPNGHLDEHTHPFSVQALVIDGFIEITIDRKTTKYASGDVFALALNQVHAEAYGPQGVRYLASRKQ
ncbi:cupin domain-containing protein [Polynucleobacter sp. UK-Kesae-W10]|uniref:cupin domain-containing protein n=1 Tax=Polynucleobacter sp. UK-Kesae-W10 TaxID=1819738 RepID=UPI001C0AF6E3|nr:cupin [Polynucleobacter sp. UK-Kesae-W10]MBU3577246.1 cupin [Polynucleobacter sp. UK-Kesae-W10]